MKLEKKVAVVTGASRGIGKGIAIALAKEGATVVVAARTEKAGPLPGNIYKTVEEIKERGCRAIAIRTDLTKASDIDNLVKETLDKLGRIDILVNNAGITIPGKLTEVSTKRWDLIMGVNLRGTFLCTRAILPTMINQKGGSIINLSSILGTRLIAGPVSYGVTKAAIERFTSGLAEEVKAHNIAVNAFCPGFTDTEGVRMQAPNMDTAAMQKVEMWGEYAVFLSLQDAGTLTGQSLTAEDFEKLMPLN